MPGETSRARSRGASPGDELGNRSGSSVLFVLRNRDGGQARSIRLYEQAYAGGGWYDDDEEVLEVRSGVIQILIAPVQETVV